jgi:hypothetical protein
MESRNDLLKSRCHVNTNEDGDRFVGIKTDSENAMVYFPIGYKLPSTDHECRRDILHLISVLSEFTNRNDRVLHMKNFEANKSVEFPANAYMEVINYYLEQRSYYMEKEPIYKTSDRGNTNWARTVRKQKALLQANNTPIYLKQSVKNSMPNERNLITQIHKYCVYESFQKLGWLFTSFLPQKPDFPIEVNRFLIELNDKLGKTFNDKDKRLFMSMIAMLKYIDEETNKRQFYFGTDGFEFVWEKLIDRVFGVRTKDDFFPKASWKLKSGRIRVFEALRPDTIMILGNKVFILDAKYYRYGVTANPYHLPEGRSIHKQITYGEYISTNAKFKDESGNNPIVFNAFLMPYNSQENIFGYIGVFENCGESVGEWKGQDNTYEHVQGVLVDVNYLMHNYTGNHNKKIIALSESIESAVIDNGFNLLRKSGTSVII